MNNNKLEKTKITYHGHSMFEIESSAGIKIITDPYNEKIKSVLPVVSADIVLVSHDHFDHANVSLVKGNPEVIRNPGISSFKDISIEGAASYHDTKKGALRGSNIIFKFVADEIVFVHMGDLGHSLDESYIEKFKDTDILMVPVGGIYTVNFLEAYQITSKIKPKVVIPMHYKEPDSKLDVDNINPFISKWQSYDKKGHSALITKEGLNDFTDIKVWVFDSK